MTSIILAGGRSSRFGWSKVLETIGSKSLVQWVIDRLTLLSREIIIVTAQGDCFTSLATTYPPSLRTKMAADIYPGKGPLGGIYTGLVTSSCSHAIVVGCDMPFLSIALLGHMAQIPPSFDIIVPRTQRGVEPLCAVYSKNCLAPINSLLERNELRISKLLSMTKVKYIEENEINKFDPEHLSFFNVNTQAELARARKLATEKGWLI